MVLTIWARDPETGDGKWAYQIVPHDAWDYDEIMENILVDMPWQGHMRKLLLHPGRTGFMFVLDRETGELLSAENFEPVTWARSYDLKTGLPASTMMTSALTSDHYATGHLSLFDGRQKTFSFRILATNRHTLYPGAQYLHGLLRGKRELHRRYAVSGRQRADVSRSRRISGRIDRLGRGQCQESLEHQGK